MLSTVLSSLSSGFTSKQFLIGAFFPVLSFVFVNALIVGLVFEPAGDWIDAQVEAGGATLAVAVLLIAIVLGSYVLSSLNGFLREQLEGHNQTLWGRSPLAKWPKRLELQRWRKTRQQFYEARTTRLRAESQNWRERLTAAAQTGRQVHPGHVTYDGTGPAAQALAVVLSRRVEATPPTYEELEAVVTAFESVLAENDLSASKAARLAADQRDLRTVLDYAADEWADLEVALARTLETQWGDGAVAPTPMGNIAASMQSYAMSRYRLDLATFWTRLQPLLQKHKALFDGLQDAKLQLDFVVALVWLCAITSAIWVVVLPLFGGPWWGFLVAAIGGPNATAICFWAGVKSYIAFADHVRTAVDLHRFDLLSALHIDVPTNLKHERRIWEGLTRVVSFGQSEIDIGYRHPAGSTDATAETTDA